MKKVVKKLFKHGGSYAIDLPMSFIKRNGTVEVVLENMEREIIIYPNTELDTIEDDPLFSGFVKAVAADAMRHPEKLIDVKKVWDEEWDELLKDVTVDDDE